MFLPYRNGEPRQMYTRQSPGLQGLQDASGRSYVISVANTFLIAIVSWLFASLALIGQVPIS